jgi:hypothetical protein
MLSSVARGMTAGVRLTPDRLGAGLVLGRTQLASDRFWVEVAPDGRIVDVEALRTSPALRRRLWPFGP